MIPSIIFIEKPIKEGQKNYCIMAIMKVIEIMGDSSKSWEDASNKAIKRASKSVKGIVSAWVQDQSVVVQDGAITSYRVTLKVTFAVK